MNAFIRQTTALMRFLGRNESERVALRTGLLYWSVAALWILLSDRLVGVLIADPDAIIRVQQYKGWAFVTVTAAILFATMRSKLMRRELEIARRKQAEEALRASEKRFAGIISSAMDAIISVDEDQRIVLFNSAAEEIFGYKSPEVMGRSLAQLIPERFHAAHQKHMQDFGHSNQTRRKKIDHVAIYGRRADGTEFPMDASISQISVAGRKTFTVILHDITERKRSEEALRESTALNQAILQTIPFGMDIVDLEGNILFLSPSMEAMIWKNGIGRKCWQVYRDDRQQCSACPLMKKIIPGDSNIIETDGVLGGRVFQISHTAMQFQGKLAVLEIFQDITERRAAEAEIRTLARIPDENPSPLMRVENDGVLIYANKASAHLLECWNCSVGQRVPEKWCELIRETMDSGSPKEAEEICGERIFSMVLAPIAGLDYLNIYARDITESKRAEEQLRKLSRAVEQSPASIVITSIAGEIEYINPKFTQVTGYTLDEVRGKNPRVLKSGESTAEEYRSLWQTIRAGKEWHGEFHNKKKNGELYWELASILPIVDEAGRITHFLAVKEDITERKAAEERIKASLKEKEVLLKEIHHRVKNNLQVISSLLKLQSRYSRDKRTIELFEESQQRVKSMALIHEELYKSPDLARIKFASYVQSIADHLVRSYGVRSNAITLNVDVDELQLDVDHAVPCGLIVNELVTNSLKYAFPSELMAQRDHRENKITIEMRLQNGAQVALKISDNGIGLPQGLDFRMNESLGLQLVNTLTEQLRGTISCNKTEGTEFEILFVAGNGSVK